MQVLIWKHYGEKCEKIMCLKSAECNQINQIQQTFYTHIIKSIILFIDIIVSIQRYLSGHFRLLFIDIRKIHLMDLRIHPGFYFILTQVSNILNCHCKCLEQTLVIIWLNWSVIVCAAMIVLIWSNGIGLVCNVSISVYEIDRWLLRLFVDWIVFIPQ